MLSCSEVTEKTSDFLDGDLGLVARAEVWMHLIVCRHCRRFVRQMRATVAMLRRAGGWAGPAEVDARLIGALRERAKARK